MFDLIKLENSQIDLHKRVEEYTAMTTVIQQNLPMIYEASGNFGKTQSQFMDNFLTVAHPTPLRNARQALAEINKSVEALREAQYNMSKKQLLIQRLKRDLADETDEIRYAEIELEINFETSKLSSGMLYVEGAIRSVANYTEQYKQILKAAGYDEMTEIDFEKEEEKYHIMKAFDQGICAARARGGLIDEGNHIYFSQIGVNGQMAQNFVNRFFEQERQALEKGATLTADFQRSFLLDMANFFQGCSKPVADAKGMTPISTSALLKAKLEEDSDSKVEDK
jgi:hypothetical protein